MGSPLGPTIANIFLCYWEEKWIEKCPNQFKPKYYNRFMDDTFLLFSSENHAKKFFRYINSRHKNMSFTSEVEEGGKLAFLDVLVTRIGNYFCTSLYRKPTFSGLYSHYKSFMPDSYKRGLVYTLLHRAHVLCSSWDKFHEEVTFLREIFMKNCYPSHFFDKIVKTFQIRYLSQKSFFYDVPKKELSICLPFLGKHSLELKSKLSRYFSKYFPACRIKVIFKCSSRLNRFLVFKDKIPSNVRSHLLYRYTCSGCNATYIGKTRRHYLVRVFEHLGISLRTHKKFTYNPNNGNNSAILNHVHGQNCVGKEENFKIIGSAANDFHLCLKESLLIQKEKPKINTSDNSMPLKLF